MVGNRNGHGSITFGSAKWYATSERVSSGGIVQEEGNGFEQVVW